MEFFIPFLYAIFYIPQWLWLHLTELRLKEKIAMSTLLFVVVNVIYAEWSWIGLVISAVALVPLLLLSAAMLILVFMLLDYIELRGT